MMALLRMQYLLLLLMLIPFSGISQESNLRNKQLTVTGDTMDLDSLSIYPNSFHLYCDGIELDRSAYHLDFSASRLFINKACDGVVRVEYRVLPMDLSKVYMVRDTSLIYNQSKGPIESYYVSTTDIVDDIFGTSGINRSGSISRGVTFGNNQDLGINSTLNLELAGQIAPNLKLLASVSDDNLPIQPEGNTNKLREFDQVFIQVYNDKFKMIAGDFWLYKPEGYFMTYKKRAQGLTIENVWSSDTTRSFKTQISGALSKGKFHRQIIQGVEGNQGPYRLRGAENEPFIIVLAGTERVYIDGRLMERGQEFDYVIDYNTSEVTFTSRNQITKDSRIVVEFQYSDQNYVRSLFQSSNVYKNEKVKFWFNLYSEQDARNQSIQQELTNDQKLLLSEIGDTLELARASSIDSIGYFENQNLYKLIDTLVGVTTYDSVLVHSVHPDSAFYRATFEYVGLGNGDYILSNYNALGKVYKWLAPVAGVSQGDYAPSRMLISPKQRQMVTSGVQVKLTKKLRMETEWAYTKNDINTFSSYDSKDDHSVAGKFKLIGDVPLSKDSIPSWIMRTKVDIETRDKNFNPIEQYRAVEFDRDWNTRNKGFEGNQLASTVGADFIRKGAGNINVEAQQFLIGTDYQGYRGMTDGKWNKKGFRAIWDGSYLTSQTTEESQFYRHRADVSKSFGWIRIGYKDDHEANRFIDTILTPNSYQFFDYQFYIANGDSIKNNYRIFYRERYDWRSDSLKLREAAKARTIGSEIKLTELKNQKLTVITSYRELTVKDSNLINVVPENTMVGRIDYQLRALKGAITSNTFYEIGSGLELKREFLYLEVNSGQGIYTWVDYNGDGVKDLNEFEIAQFVDQADYIRVFTPSNEYVKTYSNEFNQSLYLRPSRIWASKKGFLKFMSRFSDQARFRMSRKTNYIDGADAFNPFIQAISDSNLISTNSTVRNTIYFNRTSSIFGSEYTYQNVAAKTLLASGFDSRIKEYHELVTRWNIKRKYTIKITGQTGRKFANADYTSGRNYSIIYSQLEPSFIYQPNTKFRISLDSRYSDKANSEELGGERSIIYEVGTNFKYNQREKGSFQGNFKTLNISFDGESNSALGFEMLESLKPGVNYTWSLSYQRSVSRSLQLSFQYNGRKSPDNRTIHSGGMELRAFF